MKPMTDAEAADELETLANFEEHNQPSKLSHRMVWDSYRKKTYALRLGIAALREREAHAHAVVPREGPSFESYPALPAADDA